MAQWQRTGWEENVEKTPKGCWIWTGPHHLGNPVLDTSRDRPSARRFVAEQMGVFLTKNAGSRGPSVNVLCGEGSCVNPSHLRWLFDGQCPRYDEAALLFLDMASFDDIGERFGVSSSMAWTVIKRARDEEGWVSDELRARLRSVGGRRARR